MDALVLQGVKTHNLKNFDLILPHKKFYVVTGVSGSGKSSLAFDTLYAEGQRRYVESLSAYARQFLERMEKPDVDMVSGIPPALAIQAKNTVNNARSTVGTQTEINDYLRVLFARVGVTYCPDCGDEVTRSSPQSIASFLLERHEGREARLLFRIPMSKKAKTFIRNSLEELERQGFVDFFLEGDLLDARGLLAQSRRMGPYLSVVADTLKIRADRKKRLLDSLELTSRFGRGEVDVHVEEERFHFSEALKCSRCERQFREPSPNLFSFNSPLGACAECQGFGRVITIDWDLVVPDKSKTLEDGAIEPWTKPSAEEEFAQLLDYCRRKKIPLNRPWKRLLKKHRDLILFGDAGEEYFSVRDFYRYLEKKTYKMHVRILLSKYRGYVTCPVCHGSRLKPEALAVRVNGRDVAALQEEPIEDLYRFFEELQLPADAMERVEPVYLEILKRVRFLREVGLGYLSLSRLSRTLSGGEVQRIHLASSLGSALVDTLYVLDEPSIGLHERDNYMLINLLRELRDLGNTIVVVEHDRAMIEAADEVIDLGPLGGERGGELLFQGAVKDMVRCPHSLTGRYLSGEKKVERKAFEAQGAGKSGRIRITGASEHNLKDIDVEIPLRQMVVLTGVSGSGKSTLLYDILYHHYLRYKGQPVQDLGQVKSVAGLETLDQMLLIDQSPIGRTPRSNPVTYIKAFDDIRKIFAATPEAKREGFGPGFFSFNVDGGRCPECKGDGRIKVEMHFLADVFIPCEACQATRYKREILEIRYRGHNIDDILSMTIDEAGEFFAGEPALTAKLAVLQRVGLGYLRLGQSATTLSGGEAQRLKLAVEMTEKRSRHIAYLFDEPTTGLHYHDIHFLMGAFEDLLEKGHSLVIIEHNMEIIRSADHIIDLGPEGGAAGGEVLYQGPVNGLMKTRKSHTGRFLKEYLEKSAYPESAGR